jgi:hypothetical protein
MTMRKQYSATFKAQIVTELPEEQKSLSQLAAELPTTFNLTKIVDNIHILNSRIQLVHTNSHHTL